MEHLDYHSENRLVKRSSYRFIFPPMIGMIFAQIAPVIDSLCAANGMGGAALSAIGIVAPLDYVFNIVSALFGIGCGVVISRCSGTGEKVKAARVFTRALIAMVAVMLILSAAGIIFLDPLLRLLCATPENYSYARSYLTVILAGSVFLSLNFAGDYVLVNDNNEKLAMAGDIVGAVVNIIIDYVGVFVFHCGIWIIGFGTVFGSVCCCLVYLLHFRKKDRLCRIVLPVRKEGDPGLFETVKPGSAEALMYFFFALQLLVQNFTLRGDAGTSGLCNSSIIENLSLVFTIVIAGCTDAILPMASAYHGEQNKSGMLMTKRTLTRTGYILMAVPVVLLCIFPELVIMPFKINDPVVLNSLPFVVRLVSFCQLFVFFNTLLIDYLSATEQEAKANLAFVVQFAVQIPLTLVLDIWSEMNSPWYALLISQIAVLIFLCRFCGDLPEGIFRFHRKNLLVMRGGNLTPELVSAFEKEADKVTGKTQFENLKQQMLSPLLAVLSGETAPYGCFSILKRSDNRLAAVLHYESKRDLLENLPELPESDDDEEDVGEEVPPDTCIRSEFLGMRRLMMILSETAD